MKHLGDITKINGYDAPIVDIIIGGSPCQDLSVAGKRAGLAGERSGLFMEQIRIIKEMRNESKRRAAGGANVDIRPRYMVWENVPGAFSSNGGEDFRAVLEETAKVADEGAIIPGPPRGKWQPSGCVMGDGWSIAWRVHDAQFWGVPQRRKRIALVADFGGGTAPEILFEREGVSGDSAQGGEQGQAITGSVETGAREAVGIITKGDGDVILSEEKHTSLSTGGGQAGQGYPCVMETNKIYDVRITSDGTKNWRAHAYETSISRSLDTGGQDPDSNHGGVVVLNDQGGSQMNVTEDVSGTLRAQDHGHQPVVYAVDQGAGKSSASVSEDMSPTLATTHGGEPVVYGISAYESNAMKSSNPHSGIYEAETARTLDLNGGSPACNQGGGMAVVQGADVYNGALTGEVAASLTAACGNANTSGAKVVVSMATKQPSQNVGVDVAMPICANDYKEPQVVAMKCGNPWDSQSGRVYYGDGAWHSLQGNSGGGQSRDAVVCIEGNGSRPSHKGDGYAESDIMYTLNSTEQHAVCAGFTTNHSAKARGIGYMDEQSPTLKTDNTSAVVIENHPQDSRVNVRKQTVYDWHRQDTRMTELGHVCVTAEASWGSGGNNMPMVLESGASWDGSQVSPTLTAKNANGTQRMPDKNNFNAVISYGLDRASFNQGPNAKFDFSIEEERIGAQVARGPGAVCSTYQEKTGTLCAEVRKGTSNQLASDDMFIANASIVRRLTPLECTRLQGFPDGWVDIGDWVDTKGKLHKDSDSVKYKALGNSIALPFWQWMAGRMVRYINHAPTMASLFDGIGGFPLVFSRVGCKPVWASEIEEFPIAVTKTNFPEKSV